MEPEPYLRRAAERTAESVPVKVRVVDGTAGELPLEDGSVDAVVVAGVLCSVPDVAAALAEFARVLRPGGELRFYEHVRSERPGFARYQDTIDQVWPRLMGGCHPNRDTLAAIRDAGFEVERVRRFGFPAQPRGRIPSCRGSLARRAPREATVARMDLDVVFLGTGGSVPYRPPRHRLHTGPRRWGAPPVRLRGGHAAADAAVDRARPGRRDLPHALPRRSLPRPARPAQDLRPERPAGAASHPRPPGPPRPVRGAAPDHRPGPLPARARRDRRGRPDSPRHLRDPPVRRRAPRAGIRLRARRGRASGPIRPGRGRAARRAPLAPTSRASRRARRSMGPTGRSTRGRCWAMRGRGARS